MKEEIKNKFLVNLGYSSNFWKGFFLFSLLFFFFLSPLPTQAGRDMDLSMWVTEKDSGKPLDGNYDITYQLFDQEEGGNLIWEETQNYDIHTGVVSTILGKENPFPEDLDHQTTDYYLGIIVNGDPMDTRKRLSPTLLSVNSLFAENSASLQGKTIGEEEDNIPLLGTGGKLPNSLLNTGEDDDQLVLGDDERLHLQNTDTGTTNQTFNLGSNLSLSNRNFDLTVSSSSNKPTLRFNAHLNTWQLSTDGTSFGDIVIGSSLNQSVEDLEAQLATKSDINHTHESGDLPLDSLTGDLLPTLTNTYSLGSTEKRWLNTHTQNLYSDNIQATSLTINGSATLGTSGENITFNSSLIPSTSGLNLGSASNHWSNLYVDNLTVNTTDTNGTTAQYFTINTDAPDNEDSGLRFYRGPTLNTYASFLWDESEQELNFYGHEANQTLGTMNVGQLGIGTTSPSSKLDVSGSGRFYDQTATTGSTTLTIRAGAGQATSPLQQWLDTDGNSLAVMSSDGRLGIGTTSPATKLYVDGNIRTSDKFSFGSNAYIEAPSSNRLSYRSVYEQTWVTYDGISYDERMRLTSSGNLGIGTTSPQTIFHISNSNSPTIRIEDDINYHEIKGAGDNLLIGADENNAGAGSYLALRVDATEHLRIDQNGNLGIGTTSPQSKLHINGETGSLATGLSFGDGDTGIYEIGDDTLVFARNGASAFYIDNNGLRSSSTSFLSHSTGSFAFADRGGTSIKSNSTGELNFTVNGTESLTIKNGNIGIGTTSPGAKLEVAGRVLIDGTEGLQMTGLNDPRIYVLSGRFTSTGSWRGSSGSSFGLMNTISSEINPTIVPNYVDSNTGLGSAGADTLSLIAGGVNGLNVISNGNIGIGTTDPGAKLDIKGSGSDILNLQDSSGVEKVTVLENGNLGIGTTNPGAMLQVGGSIYGGRNTWQYISLTGDKLGNYLTGVSLSGAGKSFVITADAFSGSLQLKTASANDILFAPNNSNVMAIKPDGNIGIGTTSPGSKLSVSGGVGIGSSYAGSTIGDGNVAISGNLGIGTTSPQTIFHISNSNSPTIRIEDDINYHEIKGAGDNLLIGADENNAGAGSYLALRVDATEHLRIDQSGNIGIGTTGPTSRIHGYVASEWSSGIPAFTFHNNDAGVGEGNVMLIRGGGNDVTSNIVEVQDWSGNTEFQIDGLGDVTITNELTVLGTGDTTIAGNLGIGTTSPGAKLEVNGNSIFSDTIRVNGGSTLPTSVFGNLYIASGLGSPDYSQIIFGDGTGYKLNFANRVAGVTTNLVTILDNGNIGIGTTSPGSLLHLGKTPTGITSGLTFGDGDTGIYENSDDDFRMSVGGNFNIQMSSTGGFIVRSDSYNGLSLKRRDGAEESYYFHPGAAGTLQIGKSGQNAHIKIDSDNNNLLLMDTLSGNVGIGTTSPQSKLHINGGTGSLATGLTFGDGDTGIYEAIDDNLYLNVGGSEAFAFFAGSMRGSATNAPKIANEIPSSINPVFVFNDDEDTGIGRAGANILSLIAGGVNGLNVDGSGNIGIGTTGPSSALEVNGNIELTSNTNYFHTNGASNYIYPFKNTDKTMAFVIGTTTAYEGWEFLSGSSSRVKITTAGNVGIGTTGPSEKLDIVGNIIGADNDTDLTNKGLKLLSRQYNISETEGFTIVSSWSDSSSNRVLVGGGSGSTNAATDIRFYTAGDTLTRTGTEAMRITSTGNVGIGTTSPGVPLEISSDLSTMSKVAPAIGNAHLRLYSPRNSGGSTPGFSGINFTMQNSNLDRFDYAAIHSYILGNGAGNEQGGLRFLVKNNGADNLVMTMLNNGNIGIGTTGPNYKLEVSGAIMLEDMAAPTASAGHSGIYSDSGELYALDASGNATVISPHNDEGLWYYNSTNLNTDKTLTVEMEKLTKELDQLLGGGFVYENGELYTQNQENLFNKIENQFDSWIPAFAGMTEELEEQKTLLTSLYEREEELAELTLTVEGLNETDTMIIGKLTEHENRLLELESRWIPDSSGTGWIPASAGMTEEEAGMTEGGTSNDLISNSVVSLGELLEENEDEDGNVIFTLTADLELVSLKAKKVETDELESGKANFEDMTVEGINIGENSSGKAVILPGEAEVIIESSLVKEDSVIHLTLTSKKNGQDIYIKEVIEGESFVVEIEEGTALEKLEFNWLVLN